jgi:tRNA-splicing ligase RtcB (3'-phosphate/5'-hydroxy nucleic acid ligase)
VLYASKPVAAGTSWLKAVGRPACPRATSFAILTVAFPSEPGHHYGKDVLVTRKGAVRAGLGELGIIPGSMGARSYIVCGKGNPEAFESCSHGAGRVMSRTAAKKHFSLDDHKLATQGVECRKDASVIDETPGAYKNIDAVMEAQRDLVDIVHTLKQVVCVKG